MIFLFERLYCVHTLLFILFRHNDHFRDVRFIQFFFANYVCFICVKRQNMKKIANFWKLIILK